MCAEKAIILIKRRKLLVIGHQRVRLRKGTFNIGSGLDCFLKGVAWASSMVHYNGILWERGGSMELLWHNNCTIIV